MQRLIRGAVGLALLLGACGETPESVAPGTTRGRVETAVAATPSTTTTSLPTGIHQREIVAPGSSIVMRFDDRTKPALLDTVEDTVLIAKEEFGDSGALVVHVYASADAFVEAHDAWYRQTAQKELDAGLYASSNAGVIWIYGPRFAEHDTSTQRLIILHEYFHTVQLFLSSGVSRTTPLWLHEGIARYWEYRAGADRGYADFNRERRAEIRRSRGLDPLNSFESRGGSFVVGESGEAYTLGFLAADYLENVKGADAVKRDLWVALKSATDWRTAFFTVFGISTEQFYAEFEIYRRSL